MTRTTKRILILAGLVVSLALAFDGFLRFSEWPGGMRSTYAAADYDPRLTRVAATAKPLIAALKRYHDDHSAFPAYAADLVPYLSNPPAQLEPKSDNIFDWYYYQLEKSGGYVLSYKLGRDPSLNYHHDGLEERWVFNPGDGSPKKNVILKP